MNTYPHAFMLIHTYIHAQISDDMVDTFLVVQNQLKDQPPKSKLPFAGAAALLPKKEKLEIKVKKAKAIKKSEGDSDNEDDDGSKKKDKKRKKEKSDDGDEDGEKKKVKKQKKEKSDGPKRPMSAYLLFAQEKREEIM